VIGYSSLDPRVSSHWIRIARTNFMAKILLHRSRGRDSEEQGKYLDRNYWTRHCPADPGDCPKGEM